tara:strand:+ start:29 stop:1285 length:1257 start_codon:yes stop_codon:yes gene_type:complete
MKILNYNNKIKKLINNFKLKNKNSKISNYNFPLLEDGFTDEDIYCALEVLLSKKLTMSDITKKFENKFANYIGANYAVMTNSGSSANLLAAFALINPQKKNRLKPGNKFIIPAICWSTSLWPFIQSGLRPIFIDVLKNDFCLDVNKLEKLNLAQIKVVISINILGNCPDILKLKKICKENKIYLIEDSCEALGSKFKNRHLGTFGDFGTFSFYYSHQITSGEGGMVVCKKKEDYELLKVLRSHGWDRNISKKHSNNFNFINSGFNLRPLDLTASIGINQLNRLNKMKKIREYNKNKIINSIKKLPNWNNQFEFFSARKGLDPSWFGFPILINKKYLNKKELFLKYLNKCKIETRPILSGNFLKQPCVSLYKLNDTKKKFKISNEIDDMGFFIGLPTTKYTNKKVNHLINKLIQIENFS